MSKIDKEHDDWDADDYETLHSVDDKDEEYNNNRFSLDFEEDDTDYTYWDSKFFIDTSGYYTYILLNFNDEFTASLIKHLSSSKPNTVEKHGLSYKSASNGKKYNYYIRINKDIEFAKNRYSDIIQTYIEKNEQISSLHLSTRSYGGKSSEKSDELVNIKKEIYSYKEVINNQKNTIALLKKELSELNKKYEIDTDDLKRHNNVQYKLYKYLGDRYDTIIDTIKRQESIGAKDKEFIKKLEEQKEDVYSSYASDIEKLETKISVLEKKNCDLEKSSDEKDKNIQKLSLQIECARSPANIPGEEGEITFVNSYLNNIVLIRNSTQVMKTEISNYNSLIFKLMRHNCCPEKEKGKKIQSIDGKISWYDSHFNNGSRDSGRLYFADFGGKRHILVSDKLSQNRDIDYLRKYASDTSKGNN